MELCLFSGPSIEEDYTLRENSGTETKEISEEIKISPFGLREQLERQKYFPNVVTAETKYLRGD